MKINLRILQFVDYLGISQRKFTQTTKLAEGALRGSRSIGTENLIKIKQIYPELNINWVLFNEGEMVLSEENQIRKQAEKLRNVDFSNNFEDLVRNIIKDETNQRFDKINDILMRLFKREIQSEDDIKTLQNEEKNAENRV